MKTEVGMPCAGEKPRRQAGEKDDDQGNRQSPFPALHH